MVSLGGEGHECIPQCFGLFGHRRDLAFTILRFIRVEALLDVSAAVSQQAIDQTRQFVRRCRNGLGGAETHFHPPKEGSQGTLRVVQRAGGEAEGDRDAMRAGAHPPRQHLATRDFVLGTQPQPATEVFHARPPGHVRADLAEDDQSGVFFDPLNGRQVAARHAIERRAGIEVRFVGLLVAAGLRGQGLARTCIAQGLQMGFDLLITLGALLVIEGKQVFGAPGALQRLGDVVLRVVAVAGGAASRGAVGHARPRGWPGGWPCRSPR
jgi:hypothetical protein